MKLEINFGTAVSQFEKALRKFQVKKVDYQSLFRGKGLEFDSYRNFMSDDDSSVIDWKASLRANKLLARQYIEERDIRIYFVVDVSNSMLFGSGNKLKAEYAGEIIAALSHLIMSSGDSAGLIMATDRINRIVRTSKNKNQLYLMINYLSELGEYGGGFDFPAVVNFLLKTLESKAVIIFISDFLHTGKDFERNLKLLGTKFETIAFMIRDPLDEELPKANYQMSIQEPFSGKQITIDSEFAAESYKRYALEKKNYVKSQFLKSDIDFLELNTNTPFVNPLISFLKTRTILK
jgi:uncharacterized protein (DUF58 family)